MNQCITKKDGSFYQLFLDPLRAQLIFSKVSSVFTDQSSNKRPANLASGQLDFAIDSLIVAAKDRINNLAQIMLAFAFKVKKGEIAAHW